MGILSKVIKSWWNKSLCADFGHTYSSTTQAFVVINDEGEIQYICTVCGKKIWSKNGTVGIWD